MQLKQAERVRTFLTKKDALRKLLIKFAQEEEIDAKLLQKDFKVEEFEKEFLVVRGQAECSYTCSIGYDRTENYVEIEKVRKKIGDTWQYVSEPVNKTRTVTDWQA